MKIAFLSTMSPASGPTERLWVAAARLLSEAGHTIGASVPEAPGENGAWSALEEARVTVHRRWRRPATLKNRLRNRWNADSHFFHVENQTRVWLREFRPDFVHISQGSNVDAAPFMDMCREIRVPYTVCIHAASPSIWPEDAALDKLRNGYTNARFVWGDSRYCLSLTKTMLGTHLPQSGTLFNLPLLNPLDSPPEYPKVEKDLFKMACVARLYPSAKGQDILLETLAKPEWRQRNWHLTFVGDGPQEAALRRFAELLQVSERVTFAGRGGDMRAVWASHHLCVMPSRYEGLPIALTEALFCARPAVVTRETGGGDVLIDGSHGFIATSASVESVHESLTRAWDRRSDWQDMGRAAREHILDLMPTDPVRWFADQLEQFAKGI